MWRKFCTGIHIISKGDDVLTSHSALNSAPTLRNHFDVVFTDMSVSSGYCLLITEKQVYYSGNHCISILPLNHIPKPTVIICARNKYFRTYIFCCNKRYKCNRF